MNMDYMFFINATEVLASRLKVEGIRVANTIEILNVAYSVAHPKLEDLKPHQPWADTEFEDRIALEVRNPGNAWKTLPKVWEPMMEEHLEGALYRDFSYTYNERILYQKWEILNELEDNPNSREAYLAIWNPALDPFRIGRRRIPCTLGYQFFIRNGELQLTYLQRSCNFKKHYQDDVYLARKLQEWVAEQIKVTPGIFSHWIGSLHIFV